MTLHPLHTPPARPTAGSPRRRGDCRHVVVVGSGAAGLSCALALARGGHRVTVVTRGQLDDSATDLAQGGLAAVWSRQDSTDLHLSDTLTAGAGLCRRDSASDLVNRAPAALRWLMALGAHFDTGPDGHLDLHLEGGHHARRVLHAQADRSGHEVEQTLVAALGGPGVAARVEVRDHTRLVDLVRDARGRVCGLVVWSRGRLDVVAADAVVLATGGIGHLWATTTNPAVSTGDGLAAALRAGARARDVEFMQFHPTVLWLPRHGDEVPTLPAPLISEAVRGEGATLVDLTGRPVMAGLHPLGDLAPRDVVSAAEHERMVATGTDHVLLDATGFGEATWRTRFPTILASCRAHGVDPVTEPIPVAPGAHYHCGGVAATMSGLTDVPGLHAVGEVACTGVHGANRLASNSLTEALVTGHRAAEAVAYTLATAAPSHPGPRTDRAWLAPRSLATVRRTMSEHVFVQRDGAGLDRAFRTLEGLETTDELTADSLTATNAALVARAVALAGLTRTESRGCHRRLDHPEPLPQWHRHLDVRWDRGRLTVSVQGERTGEREAISA